MNILNRMIYRKAGRRLAGRERCCRRVLAHEYLETRCVLTATLSLSGAQSLVTGTNLNVSNTDGAGAAAEAEMSVEVNPVNPLNIAAFTNLGNSNAMDVFFSTTGGATWTRTRINDIGGDGIAGVNDDGLGVGNRFDPTLKFDSLGQLYLAYGASIGNQTSLVVAKSTTGGASFSQFTVVETRSNDGTTPGVDKWMLATGPDPSTGNPVVYVSYTQNQRENVWLWTEVDQRIVVSGSNDGALTFTSPRTINDGSIGAGTDWLNLFASPAVGPNGELYVVWHDGDAGKIRFDADRDGLFARQYGFGSDVTVQTLRSSLFKTTSIKGGTVNAQPNRGIHAGPVLDVDLSGGPRHGQLHVTFVDVDSGTDSDVFLTTSTDQGRNWESKGLVEQIANDTSTEFLPWLDVDQSTGSVNVLYYPTVGDLNTGDNDVNVWIASSFDGGHSFVSTPLSTARSRASTAATGSDFLDYIGLAVHDGSVHGFWSDNRGATAGTFSSDLDAYTATASFRINDRSNPYNQSNTLGMNYTLSTTRLMRPLSAAISFDGLENVQLNAGTRNDSVTISSLASWMPVTIDGGGATDTLVVTANAAHRWEITAANGGKLDNIVTFSSVENLTGGPASDQFVFEDRDSVAGTINGGGGTDTVDYSACTTNVAVDLTAGAATGTAGVVQIENATGGSSHDVLIGSTAGNVLRGGNGRDLLVGGRGKDTLYGDADEDILISGATDLAAIDAAYGYIMLEWTRRDRRFTQPVDHLRNGGGANGDARLTRSTVLDDDAVDTLWRGHGQDWFFASLSDSVRDLAEGDRLDYLYPPLELPGFDDPTRPDWPPI